MDGIGRMDESDEMSRMVPTREHPAPPKQRWTQASPFAANGTPAPSCLLPDEIRMMIRRSLETWMITLDATLDAGLGTARRS